ALHVDLGEKSADQILLRAAQAGINLRKLGEHAVGISLDETTRLQDVRAILDSVLNAYPELRPHDVDLNELSGTNRESRIENRSSKFLTHPVFNTHHTETEMSRYLKRLESRD